MKRTNRTGLTLIESLIGVTVALILVGILNMLHAGARKLFCRADVNVEAIFAARTALALIQDDLDHLVAVPAALGSGLPGCPLVRDADGALAFAADAIRLSVPGSVLAIPTLREGRSGPQVVWVKYHLERLRAGEAPALVREGAARTVHRGVRLSEVRLKVVTAARDPGDAKSGRRCVLARLTVTGTTADERPGPATARFTLSTLVGLDAATDRLDPAGLVRAWQPVETALAGVGEAK